MAKIIGSVNGQMDIKRFHLPGVKIEDNCPDCLKPIHWNGDSDYLGYPKLNSPVDFYFNCTDCGKSWTVQGSLAISINL